MLKKFLHIAIGVGLILSLSCCCWDGCDSSFLSETNNYPYTASRCCADGCGGGGNCCSYQSNDWW